MNINDNVVGHEKKRSSFYYSISLIVLLFLIFMLGGCASPKPKPIDPAMSDFMLSAPNSDLPDSVVPELAPYGPDYEHIKAKEQKLASEQAENEQHAKEKQKIDYKVPSYSISIEYAYLDTGVLTKAGQASINSVNGHLLDSSADENGYGVGFGLDYMFPAFDWNEISPRVGISYEISRGMGTKEYILRNDGLGIMGERELEVEGVRFGGGFGIPFGQNNSWTLGFELGGTYMKSTVDLTVEATFNGEEIGSVEKSASKTSLNPYGQVGVMFDWLAWKKRMKEREARLLAGAGVRLDKITILDPNQGEFSDTKTSVYLDLTYKF